MTDLTTSNEHHGSYTYDDFLDASHLKCPLPILETKKRFKLLKVKSILLIKTSDPSFKLDITVYTKKTGHKLLNLWQEDIYYYALVQK